MTYAERHNLVYVEENDGMYNEIICKVSTKVLERAKKEFNLYLSQKGETYELDTHKNGNLRRFCKFFFGKFDEDFYYGYGEIESPTVYLCTNYKVAEKLYQFLKPLEYFDVIAKHGCCVERENKKVFVHDYDH